MEHKYYIVAENYLQYMNWISSNRPCELIPELLGNQPCHIIYVDTVHRLKGLSKVKGFYLKGCENRPDYQQIKNFIDTIKHFANAPVNNGAISGTIMPYSSPKGTGTWFGEAEGAMVVDEPNGKDAPGRHGTDG